MDPAGCFRYWAEPSIRKIEIGVAFVAVRPERQGGQVFSRSPNCERMGRLFSSHSIGQRSSS